MYKVGDILKGKNEMKQRQNHVNGANKGALYTHTHTHVSAEKQNPSESGRSMVEMLGVLAVVGVLSVGGIAG